MNAYKHEKYNKTPFPIATLNFYSTKLHVSVISNRLNDQIAKNMKRKSNNSRSTSTLLPRLLLFCFNSMSSVFPHKETCGFFVAAYRVS